MKKVIKVGKLSNGFERDKGKVVHLAESAYNGEALCGDRPKIQWSIREDLSVNCKKCLKKLNEIMGE